MILTVSTDGYPVRAELPGTVSYLVVSPGLEIEAGAPLLFLDSMKMEIPVLAPRSGTVRRIVVGPGDQVQQGDLMAVLEPF